jgi:methylase of polypeptide subunit release factors
MQDPGPATSAVTSFDGLSIEHGPDVLTPRAWTAVQAQWATTLLAGLPCGPVLELCCGAGQIGLLVARATSRRLVQVDADAAACRLAARNARANGLSARVEVRHSRVECAARPSERFSLVLADPPYVPSAETAAYPQDPLLAIDGGTDGLDIARACVTAAELLLLGGGLLVLQLRDAEQVRRVSRTTDHLELVGVHTPEALGALACFRSPGLPARASG